jgi:ubiquitin carboxyl-terminal hydrolase 22/27/51
MCLCVRGLFWLQGVGKKLNTPLIFAAHLDVRPYLSSTVLQKRFTAKWPSEQPRNGRSGGEADDGSVIYELYAVVCHRGNLQARIISLCSDILGLWM